MSMRDKVVALKTSFLSSWGFLGTMERGFGYLWVCTCLLSVFGTLLASSLNLAHAHAKGELIINQKVRERERGEKPGQSLIYVHLPPTHTLSHLPYPNSFFVVILHRGKSGRLGLR